MPASSNSSRRWPARAPAKAGLVLDTGVQLPGGAPERRQRRPVPCEVPDAGGDDAVEPGHARHLGQARDGIRHEVHDELRERRVEAAVRERQLVRRGEVDVDAGIARAGRRDERLGRIDGRDRVGAEPADELARQRARPGADVEHRPLVADAGEVRQLRGERRRVPPHEAVVGVGGDVEAHCLTAVTLPAARHTIGGNGEPRGRRRHRAGLRGGRFRRPRRLHPRRVLAMRSGRCSPSVAYRPPSVVSYHRRGYGASDPAGAADAGGAGRRLPQGAHASGRPPCARRRALVRRRRRTSARARRARARRHCHPARGGLLVGESADLYRQGLRDSIARYRAVGPRNAVESSSACAGRTTPSTSTGRFPARSSRR